MTKTNIPQLKPKIKNTETTNYFQITIKNPQTQNQQTIDFQLEINQNGEITDGYSFNPTQGWVGYTQFTQGWTEQNTEENTLLQTLKEFLQTEAMWIEDLVATQDTPQKKHYTTYQDYQIILTEGDTDYFPEPE